MRVWMLVASDDATLGLGHQERRADLAFEQRLGPLADVLGRAVLEQRLHVAGVRRRAVEHLRRPVHAPHDLAQRRVLEVGQRAAVRLRPPQVPQAGGLRLRLELLDDRHRLPAPLASHVLVPLVLVRIDVLRHESEELLAAAPAPWACIRSSRCPPQYFFDLLPAELGHRPRARSGIARMLARRRAVDHALQDPLQDRGDAEQVVGDVEVPVRSARCRLFRCARSIAPRTRPRRGMPSAADPGRRCRGTAPAGCASSCSDRRNRRADRRASTAPSRAPRGSAARSGWKMALSRRKSPCTTVVSGLRRNVLRQPGDEVVHRLHRLGLRGLVLLGPARDLALDVVAGLAEVLQADGAVIDGVQLRDDAVQLVPDRARARPSTCRAATGPTARGRRRSPSRRTPCR